jgi:Fic family protein
MLTAVRKHFRIPFVWSSNAIDGSTFSEAETRLILEDEVSVGRKPIKDLLAVVGLNKAYEHMFQISGANRVGEGDILEFHRLIGDSLSSPQEAGRWRTKKAEAFTAGGPEFPAPEGLPWLMKDVLKKCGLNRFLMHPVRLGVNFHIAIMEARPFAEGNGRVARLAMNAVFLQNGFLPASIGPAHKREYMYGFSGVDENNVKFFENFVAGMVAKTQEDFLKSVEAGKIVI